PIPGIPSGILAIPAVQVMAGRKKFDFDAYPFQGFELTRHVQRSVDIPANVQGNNTHVVPGDKVLVLFFIINSKSKYPVEVVQEIRSSALVQRQDDFTIAFGLEGVIRKFFADLEVVVYFSVRSQYQRTVRIVQGLFS